MIPAFYGYWNFYEWQECLDGIFDGKQIRENFTKSYDLPLLCFTIIALFNFKKICNLINVEFVYSENIKLLQNSLKNFYVTEFKAYKTFLEGKIHFSKLANSLAILANPNFASNYEIAKLINENNNFMVEATLSMKIFKYDALLQVDKKYKKSILKEIMNDYNYVLANDATSVWETIKGAEDFDGAGSLCHGWSALPVYYFNIIYNKDQL